MAEVNVEYAWALLARARAALARIDANVDVGARERAAETVAKWERVIAGIASGAIVIGERTPTSEPAWVSLEVVHGGFATGGRLAGGALAPFELELRARIGAGDDGRLGVNVAMLESAELVERLETGCYRIDVPEEGALLVVAWLRSRGHVEAAAELVATLAPWFHALRFYPVPAAVPMQTTADVRRQDLAATLACIATDRPQRRVAAMRESILVWAPLADRAVALALETVTGAVPRLEGGRVAGGWPCQQYPDGWDARVRAFVADCERLRSIYSHSRRPERSGETLTELRALLGRCAADPAALSGRDVGRIRRIIAAHVGAHGVPGTESAHTRRVDQAIAIAQPLHRDLRGVLVSRLAGLPGDAGITALEPLVQPITRDEARRHGVPEASAMPAYLVAKLARSWDAPLERLVERGVLPSSEELARVLPSITAHARAQAFADPALQRLYAAIYTAFRRRRSLLLLNYQKQVQLDELPWIAALAAFATQPAGAGRLAQHACTVTLAAFPARITPNKLVTELAALAAAAGQQPPLVEELAADIFMGGFSEKFVAAAQVAAELLAGSLYARYYAIDYTRLAAGRAGVLEQLCRERAGTTPGESTAGNGKLVEQAQIVTTHNLASLYARFALADQLDARELAQRCFGWITRQLRIHSGRGIHVLRRIKNSAYAWRQLVFFLSFTDATGFVPWARDRLAYADAEFRHRFAPVVRGLELAIAGMASDDDRFAAAGGRVFTGWSTERHWLSPS